MNLKSLSELDIGGCETCPSKLQFHFNPGQVRSISSDVLSHSEPKKVYWFVGSGK